MRLLAEIRASGVAVRLEGGRLLASGLSDPGLLERARESRTELLDILRDEALDGPEYQNSAYFITVETLYLTAKSCSKYPILKEDSERLIDICWQLDAAFWESLSAGVDLLKARSEEIQGLADKIAIRSGWLLEGERLRKAAIEEFAKLRVLNLEALA